MIYWFALVITYGGLFEGERSVVPFPDAATCSRALELFDRALRVKDGAEVVMMQCLETKVTR